MDNLEMPTEPNVLVAKSKNIFDRHLDRLQTGLAKGL
jgi:hypothetical protein